MTVGSLHCFIVSIYYPTCSILLFYHLVIFVIHVVIDYRNLLICTLPLQYTHNITSIISKDLPVQDVDLLREECKVTPMHGYSILYYSN